MRISRLLALSLLTSAFTIPGNGQSSSPAPLVAPHAPFQIHLNSPPPKFESGELSAQPEPNLFRLPQPGPNSLKLPQPPANLFKLPRRLHNPFRPTQNTLIASADNAPDLPYLITIPRHIVTAPRPNDTCYAIRSYTVAPDSPGSESTHPTGSSTCQPAANFKLKAAADPRIETLTGLLGAVRSDPTAPPKPAP